ncbi:MFS transporter [Methylocapsa sp. S129]|uniref:MFS transporter n=1 Tax=Methylocapsa sp. S129 TaxID=1641869 RepID=UPI001AED989A|nr:MFS transporter [Methylocapsa sp. S129]
MSTVSASHTMTPIYWMALGTFAIGTEGFMIAPLLPSLAGDLTVSVAAAGQLVTVFALTYAVSSPILTALTGNLNRRRLLVLSMISFALANIVAFAAKDYWALMTARVLLAVAAGLYVPNANALAGALVGPERRGAALAIVSGGTTVAVALGVPLGAIIGEKFGWRAMFAGVGVLALIATLGLLAGLARDVGSHLPAVGLRERLGVIRRPGVAGTLFVTTLWATGAYTVYTYIASFLYATAGIEGSYLSAVLFVWGLSAAAGIFVGGTLTDKHGPQPVILLGLLFLALAFASLSVSATLLSKAVAIGPALVAIVVWGLSAWAFFPAQQTRLIGIAGIKVAPVVLSLNASFMFLGFSLGAALGSVTLTYAAPSALGWVGSLCVLASLLLSIRTMRTTAAMSEPVLQQ